MTTTQNTEMILLLGNVDHEGILSTIKTSRFLYQKKLLESKRENWGSIVELVKSPKTSAIIVKLTAAVYNLLHDASYDWVANELLAALSKKRVMVFAYESLMDPSIDQEQPEDDDIDDEFRYYGAMHRPRPLPETREAVNERLQRHGLQAISYSSNAELT